MFSSVTSFNICLISVFPKVKGKDRGAGTPRNLPSAAVVEKGCNTALPVITDVTTLNPVLEQSQLASGMEYPC